MMQVIIPRWRNALISNSTILLRSSPIHSTPAYSEKWKIKWSSAFGQPQQRSKSYVRYATRQKRADAKRALKDLLFNGGSSKITVQNYFHEIFGTSHEKETQEDHLKSSYRKSSSKSSDHRASKARRRRMKRKIRQEGYGDEFDAHFETIFQASFGNRWFSWSFRRSNESNFRYSANGFEWRRRSNWTNHENREQKNASDNDSDSETCVVGSLSERQILGLPLKGSLKKEDVKKAFHLSALKWHPDKHQSSTQAMAEEKFKHCVNAYKSLSDALT